MTKTLVVLNMQESSRDCAAPLLPDVLDLIGRYGTDADARIMLVVKDVRKADRRPGKRDVYKEDTLLSEISDALIRSKARVDILTTAEDDLASSTLLQIVRRDFLNEEGTFEICGCALDRSVTPTALLLRVFAPKCRVTVNLGACTKSKTGKVTASCCCVMQKCGVDINED